MNNINFESVTHKGQIVVIEKNDSLPTKKKIHVDSKKLEEYGINFINNRKKENETDPLLLKGEAIWFYMNGPGNAYIGNEWNKIKTKGLCKITGKREILEKILLILKELPVYDYYISHKKLLDIVKEL